NLARGVCTESGERSTVRAKSGQPAVETDVQSRTDRSGGYDRPGPPGCLKSAARSVDAATHTSGVAGQARGGIYRWRLTVTSVSQAAGPVHRLPVELELGRHMDP